MPAPLRIDSINHVARNVKDIERTKAFYCDVLGFREIRRPGFPFSGAWLFNYGMQIHLIEGDAGLNPETISGRAEHLAFHVPDADAAIGCLEEHGIEYLRTVQSSTGVVQVFFLDPDGHHIELATYLPVVELTAI
jgi:catechol 2,3-dioxygenase-like lactoylglutathione lyase family enzyme